MVNSSNAGWECPKCGMCFAPWVANCGNCVGREFTIVCRDSLTTVPCRNYAITIPVYPYSEGINAIDSSVVLQDELGGIKDVNFTGQLETILDLFG